MVRSAAMPRRTSTTLADALEGWLTARSAGRGVSDNTRRAYRADMEAVAARMAGPAAKGDERKAAERVAVAQLTPEAVVGALAAMQREGLGPATRARVHGTLAGVNLVSRSRIRNLKRPSSSGAPTRRGAARPPGGTCETGRRSRSGPGRSPPSRPATRRRPHSCKPVSLGFGQSGRPAIQGAGDERAHGGRPRSTTAWLSTSEARATRCWLCHTRTPRAGVL